MIPGVALFTGGGFKATSGESLRCGNCGGRCGSHRDWCGGRRRGGYHRLWRSWHYGWRKRLNWGNALLLGLQLPFELHFLAFFRWQLFELLVFFTRLLSLLGRQRLPILEARLHPLLLTERHFGVMLGHSQQLETLPRRHAIPVLGHRRKNLLLLKRQLCPLWRLGAGIQGVCRVGNQQQPES